MSDEEIDYYHHCLKCRLHKSQWYYASTDRGVCQHESKKPPFQTSARRVLVDRSIFIEDAAKIHKFAKSLREQRKLGICGVIDELYMKRIFESIVVTQEEIQHIEMMWEIFERLGARFGNG